jgi:Tc5 transposase DNA-binding domain.
MIWPMITEKANTFYDEIQITDKCMFSKVWMQNFKRTNS